jgi:hypothetical protein
MKYREVRHLNVEGEEVVGKIILEDEAIRYEGLSDKFIASLAIGFFRDRKRITPENDPVKFFQLVWTQGMQGSYRIATKVKEE